MPALDRVQAGLILIHRFPLSLLFNNHPPFPFPFVDTIYKPSLLYLGFLTLPTPIYAYDMPVHYTVYRPALHCMCLYRLCYCSNTTLQI